MQLLEVSLTGRTSNQVAFRLNRFVGLQFSVEVAAEPFAVTVKVHAVLTCHPHQHQLTDQGLFDVRTGNPISLVLEETEA